MASRQSRGSFRAQIRLVVVGARCHLGASRALRQKPNLWSCRGGLRRRARMWSLQLLSLLQAPRAVAGCAPPNQQVRRPRMHRPRRQAPARRGCSECGVLPFRDGGQRQNRTSSTVSRWLSFHGRIPHSPRRWRCRFRVSDLRQARQGRSSARVPLPSLAPVRDMDPTTLCQNRHHQPQLELSLFRQHLG